MAGATADIRIRRSTTAGSAGFSTTQANPQACLGKFMSTTELPVGRNTLVADYSGTDSADAQTRYHCLFAHNNEVTDSAPGVTIHLAGGDPAGGVAVALAVDPTAASAEGSTSAQALQATSLTAPGVSITGLSYSTPTSDAGGLALGTLTAGQCRAFWVRTTGLNVRLDPEEITLVIGWE